MDPQAYLMNQGWSGPGNPLNPSRRLGAHGGLGLTKPILVARKKNTHGIGKKTTHDHTNQWWLHGFEAALRSIGTDGNATPGSGGSTPETPKSELYKFFVRGPGLAGTINPNEYSKSLQSSTPDGDTPSSSVNRGTSNQKKKRKREYVEALPTVDASQGKKERKKKSRDKKGRLAICGIATPPEEEDPKEPTPYIETVESMREEISGGRKRGKEEKRKKKRRQAETLATELHTKSRRSDQSSDEDSLKRELDRKRATKKARIEEKQGKKKEKEEREKKAERKLKRSSKD
ncbi:hypothetical protein H112_00974 [Trichophyton rubrum D6]|uniref:G-patch domain-containing protein n=5 Tax=Trichophyton TaxID=5550 RepID=A0A178F5W5_TRIRU|nr:uncharacterized protein TERG_07397 [Trichophyton rubrum CBS 118892]EZF26985.1 hypothetical protein H100_00974 [Trichophyton rubrum MR850]EZF46028.1 hypothetical protein H102_00965 [Trichophyton rubrum CBS 100081]EZF56613.1 hypothetical protein H103_00974 [Trichophyton rubrum CBS 288.86]EZF67273.1 hypothetical protein H104_00957 [Trichophyton rubrum CBS 289.86]EZF77922.1 hypothetical protein H105_00971 [Trichophyton soudanense CBS 452.61]EZF88573.1 hypothetical protein H110_00974 [Trichophy